MNVQAKTIWTPVGALRAPLHPLWPQKLAQCKTSEDLFALVKVDGFIDPDALNEVQARDLYSEYCAWRQQQGA